MDSVDSSANSNGKGDTEVLSLTLGGFRLDFENGQWRAVSELDAVANDINKVLNERDHALTCLAVAEVQIQELHKEITEINSTKKVALEMLLEEKKQNIIMKQQLEGYKAELLESYQTILELRKFSCDR